jgi:hypothetical protein
LLKNILQVTVVLLENIQDLWSHFLSLLPGSLDKLAIAHRTVNASKWRPKKQQSSDGF